MSESGYNGWSNYETWAVSLWLNNDQGEQESCLRTVDDARRHAPDTVRVYVADALKESTVECGPELGASLYADLLGSALDRVDWFEIADSFIEVRDDELASA